MTTVWPDIFREGIMGLPGKSIMLERADGIWAKSFQPITGWIP